MHLLLTVFAAVIATTVWYRTAPQSKMQLGLLCWLFWGASIMWFVDALAEYVELRAEYFTPAPADMLNDTFLGLSVIALALVIWLVRLLISDPRGVIKARLNDVHTASSHIQATPVSQPPERLVLKN
ncbi:MAG: hypothetical protein MR006_07125 [Arcanobacterium sp.]|nr:hypothetical protein [Arcanobacterium sp.]MDY5588788.1 hypothetical protein [Arcanobacterium sp.]